MLKGLLMICVLTNSQDPGKWSNNLWSVNAPRRLRTWFGIHKSLGHSNQQVDTGGNLVGMI